MVDDEQRKLAAEHWPRLEAACRERWGFTWELQRAQRWGSILSIEAAPPAESHQRVKSGQLPGSVILHVLADGACEWAVGPTSSSEVYGAGATLEAACEDLVLQARKAAAEMVARAERINAGRHRV